jgi:hypothetical protein
VVAVVARIRVDEQLEVVVAGRDAPVHELVAHSAPGGDPARLSEAKAGSHLEYDGVDDAHASHADERRCEQVVVAHELPSLAGRVRSRGVGRAVARLEPHQTPAAGHDVERAHEIRQRPVGQPGPVRGRRDHARNGLPVVAAHVRQRIARVPEQLVELTDPCRGAHPHEQAVFGGQRLKRLAGERSRQHEEAAGQPDVRPRVPRPDGPHRDPLVLGVAHERDQLFQAVRLAELERLARLVARVVVPGGSERAPYQPTLLRSWVRTQAQALAVATNW